MTGPLPDRIRTVGELEDVTRLHKRRISVQENWGMILCILGPLGLVALFLGWFPANDLIRGPVAAISVIAIVVGRILDARANRAVRALASLMQGIVPDELEPSPLEAGDRIGRCVVLESESGLLHVTDRCSLGELVFRRILLCVLGAMLVALAVAALVVYGAGLGAVVGSVPGKLWLLALVVTWVAPLVGLGMIVASLLSHPVQWIASRAEGTLSIEQVIWIGVRRLEVVPVAEVTGYYENDGTIMVGMGRARRDLITLPRVEEVAKGKDRLPKELADEFVAVRLRRIVLAVKGALET